MTAAIQKRDLARDAKKGGGRKAAAGPSRTTRSTQKRDTDGVGGGNAVAGPEIGGIVDSEGQARWDKDVGKLEHFKRLTSQEIGGEHLAYGAVEGRCSLGFSLTRTFSLSQRTFPSHQYNM
jgi:hypothetical protein